MLKPLIQLSAIRPPLLRFAAIFLITALVLALGCADRQPMPTEPRPAAKANEAFGFDFRIEPTGEVMDRLGWTYIWAIRFAAQRWEQIVYAGHEVTGFVDMAKADPFVLEHDGHETRVLYPATYLGWTNILVVVTIDDEIEEEYEDDLLTVAYLTYFRDDNGNQYPVVYFSIAHYVIDYLDSGEYSYDDFYQICVHELGHALGFNSTLVGRDLLQMVAGKWEYKGREGKAAFRRMTGRTGNIPMEDSGHFDGYHYKWRRYFDVMFQGFSGYFIPMDKLISEATVGVLEDLGYWVRYDQADYTLLEWRNDPRNPSYAAKPVAGHRHWHHAPPRVGVVRRLEVEPAEAGEWME